MGFMRGTCLNKVLSRAFGDKMLNNKREFIKILENIKPSRNTYEVFSDWLIMAAASLYTWKKDKSVENEYLEIAKHYSKEELKKHAQLLTITVNALEEKVQDFLGDVFITANLTNAKKAQFFTPYNISQLMAELMIGNNKLPINEVCKVCDPCCGSGGLLIAGAMVMKENGFNYQRNALFVGTDIDARCARMTFIQLSLLGAPAIIICGNTLSKEVFWERETIGYYIAGMNFRARNLEQEIQINPSNSNIQGELF